MIILEYVIVGYFIAYFFLTFLILILFRRRKLIGNQSPKASVTPYVSVLIAARNEEANIIQCLESINKLDYPQDRLEVLIGNDQSEDATEKLVKEFIKDKSNFRLVNISSTLGNARGKANVLAHLAKSATGDYFCITDADIKVPSGWVKAIMAKFEKGIGIVSGVTLVDGKGILAKLQNIEWAYAFANIQVATDNGFPITAVGNNMAISKEAYKGIGGYEKIPFSVTEDYELFKQTILKGYHFKNCMSKELLAISSPVATLKGLLIQRRRWMQGALELPWFLVMALALQGMFFLFLVAGFLLSPWITLVLWLGKIGLQTLLVYFVYDRVGYDKSNLKYMLVFEVYSLLFSVASILNYFFARKIKWKGRVYNH